MSQDLLNRNNIKQTFLKVIHITFALIIFNVSVVFAQAPSDISGLKLWLKSDSGIILNGSTVSDWIDQSGNGNNFYQYTPSNQPSFVSNGLNSLPVLRFSGIEILNGPTISGINASSITIFILSSGGLNVNSYHILFDFGPASGEGLWLSRNQDAFKMYCSSETFASLYGDLPNAGFQPKIFEYVKDFESNVDSKTSAILIANSGKNTIV